MKVIALVGPVQSGKSTLAFSFSKFLQKKGFKAEVANMGERAKALKYQPFWDFRDKKHKKTDWLKLAREMDLDFVILDFTAPLENFFFFSEADHKLEKSDVVLLVFEARSAGHEDAEALAKAFAERLEKKVIAVENKSDIAKTSFSFPTGVVSVSAWEKRGFEKLYEALKIKN